MLCYLNYLEFHTNLVVPVTLASGHWHYWYIYCLDVLVGYDVQWF